MSLFLPAACIHDFAHTHTQLPQVTPIKIHSQLAKTIELAQPKLKPKDEPQHGFGVGARGVGLPEDSPLAGKGPRSPRRLPGATKTRWLPTAATTKGGKESSKVLLSSPSPSPSPSTSTSRASTSRASTFASTEAPRATIPPASSTSEWAEFHDDTGHVYYHNRLTGETTWRVPEGWPASGGNTAAAIGR